MNIFSNKVAIVTGGSRGIGKTIAEMFNNEGAIVYVTYKNSIDENYFNEKKIRFSRCDVTVSEEVTAFINKITGEHNSIDILVNNAGVTKDGLLMRMSEEDWDIVLNTNLKGAFNFTKSVSRVMMNKRKGKIINISSVVGLTGNAGQANYVASKAGLIGFTKSIARELASRNINVNAIAPGFIETEMTEKLSDEVKKNYLNSIPLKRFANPEEIAKAVKFLASEDSDYITGQTLNIDGGLVMY
jgi:3-oxoacyl-[acyl-carrier protein] reductase